MYRGYEEKSYTPWVIGIASFLGGVLVGVLFMALIWPNLAGVEVPNVVGMRLEDAQVMLEMRGFKVYKREGKFDNEVKLGCVVVQEPVGGASIRRGGIISLIPSKGPEEIKVPVMTGIPLIQAKALLEQAGLALGKVDYASSDSIPKDGVISSFPPFGTIAKKGQMIDLTISSGLGEVAVPSLLWKGKSRASEVLKTAGLILGEVKYVISEETDPGLIVRQKPEAGTKVSKGSTVDIWISTEGEEEEY
ncbi:MAG: PASTA domain-containing protein [Candidatus Edwardsbacteria bacterium]